MLEAKAGRQALERAGALGLDLVLTDLAVPEMEGLEMIQLLRKRQPGLKVIVMSAAFHGDSLKAAEMLGAWARLAKPVRPAQLLEMVKRVLSEG